MFPSTWHANWFEQGFELRLYTWCCTKCCIQTAQLEEMETKSQRTGHFEWFMSQNVWGELWQWPQSRVNFADACARIHLFCRYFSKAPELTAVVLLRRALVSHKVPREFSFLEAVGRKVGNGELLWSSAGFESINLSLFILWSFHSSPLGAPTVGA